LIKNISIIGTGLMGYPVAQNIAKNFSLKSYNRSFNKMKGLEKSNIKLCTTLNDICKDVEVLVMMLPGDEEVLEIIYKIKDLLSEETTVIDMSSTKVSTANECYKILKKNKINFLDAPVSGGPEGVKSASLAIMVGGDKKVFDSNKLIFNTLGKAMLVGPNGSGQLAKLCNQIIVGVTIGAVAEAVILCEKVGANPENFIKAVAGGFADSKILQNHGSRMIAKDFEPRGKSVTHLKDMNNILKCAEDASIDLPISKLIQSMYQSIVDRGLGNDDHSALYKEILEQNKK
jgi:2-hydroxy-3-oxopropionate reductase